MSHQDLTDAIRANVARAIEDAARTPEDVAQTAGVPAEDVREGRLTIVDLYRVAMALSVQDTFAEWFKVPEPTP